MRQASHYICGTSPADRVVKSVLTGAGIGAVTGGFGGFVAGEVFGGEVTFGLTGIPGAYIHAAPKEDGTSSILVTWKTRDLRPIKSNF
jgi:hypothetical protein